ncbi:hypothetical protein [Gramella sp. AN32]|uniref:YD repeat-containing protein n=1 Tax=Christiangramia antarctica TaxID=2058158 RepID=A0ABW5XCI9_9FLAO|nr:hypothetical protein [Gramella sp. AN32]MCM4155567.1 hypothetical protein [Gramella sp. AN32]
MKLRFCTIILSILISSCSSDSATDSNDDNPVGISGDFVGYTTTFNQTGTIYNYTYEDGKWLSLEVNGDLWVEIEYNDNDELVRITEDREDIFTDIQFEYDGSGSLIAVKEFDAESNSFKDRAITYSGNIVELEKLNTTEENSGKVVFTFNDDRFMKFEDFDGDAMLVHSDELQYDSSGNVIQNKIFTSYSGLTITEEFGYEYDDMANPLQDFFQDYTLAFLIYGSKVKFFNYEISTAIRVFGPNNRTANIYPSSYTENQKLDIENEYNGTTIKTQSLIFRPENAVIQVNEFLYSE